MKAQFERGTERTGLSLRTDIKAAMEKLQQQRSQQGGGYVSLGWLFSEAALLLLEHEGIELEPVTPRKAPAKAARRKRAA